MGLGWDHVRVANGVACLHLSLLKSEHMLLVALVACVPPASRTIFLRQWLLKDHVHTASMAGKDAVAWLETRSLEGADSVMTHATLRTLLVLRGVRGLDGVQWVLQDIHMRTYTGPCLWDAKHTDMRACA